MTFFQLSWLLVASTFRHNAYSLGINQADALVRLMALVRRRAWQLCDLNDYRGCVYQPHGWKAPCRFVAMRIPIESIVSSDRGVQRVGSKMTATNIGSFVPVHNAKPIAAVCEQNSGINFTTI